MPIAEDDSGTPFRMVVEAGKVREFATATGSRHPEHHQESEPVSPMTFLAASLFWRGPDSVPRAQRELDPQRTLHGSQEFVFHGPPLSAGTLLDCRIRTSAQYEKSGSRGGRMRFVELTTEYRSTSGELVAEAISTLIETAPPPGDGSAS